MFEIWFHFTKINKNLVDSFSDINIDFNHIFSCSHSSGCSLDSLNCFSSLFHNIYESCEPWVWTFFTNFSFSYQTLNEDHDFAFWFIFGGASLMFLLNAKVFFWDMSIFFLSFSLNIWIVTSEFGLWVLDEWCPWCTHPLKIKMQLGRIHP